MGQAISPLPWFVTLNPAAMRSGLKRRFNCTGGGVRVFRCGNGPAYHQYAGTIVASGTRGDSAFLVARFAIGRAQARYDKKAVLPDFMGGTNFVARTNYTVQPCFHSQFSQPADLIVRAARISDPFHIALVQRG
jgi:hypothetical protein